MLRIIFLILIMCIFSCSSDQENETNENEPIDKVKITEFDFQHYKSISGIYRSEQWASNSDCRRAYQAVVQEFNRIQGFLQGQTKDYRATIEFHNHLLISDVEFFELVSKHIEVLNRDFNEFQSNDKEFGGYDGEVFVPEIEFDFIINPNLGFTSWEGWNNFKNKDRSGNTIEYKPEHVHIWVIDIINDNPELFNGNGIGYTSAFDCDPENDGIVMDRTYFLDHVSTHNGGKVLSLLMGEYLGLAPLQDYAPCGDDGIRDTPRHDVIFELEDFERRKMARSNCDNRLPLFENYMSYSPDINRCMFTKQQAHRIEHFIENSISLSQKFSRN